MGVRPVSWHYVAAWRAGDDSAWQEESRRTDAEGQLMEVLDREAYQVLGEAGSRSGSGPDGMLFKPPAPASTTLDRPQVRPRSHRASLSSVPEPRRSRGAYMRLPFAN